MWWRWGGADDGLVMVIVTIWSTSLVLDVLGTINNYKVISNGDGIKDWWCGTLEGSVNGLNKRVVGGGSGWCGWGWKMVQKICKKAAKSPTNQPNHPYPQLPLTISTIPAPTTPPPSTTYRSDHKIPVSKTDRQTHSTLRNYAPNNAPTKSLLFNLLTTLSIPQSIPTTPTPTPRNFIFGSLISPTVIL